MAHDDETPTIHAVPRLAPERPGIIREVLVDPPPMKAAQTAGQALAEGIGVEVRIDPIRHIALGDLVDTFRAAGLNVKVVVEP